jgi:hypothetical protein
VERGTECLPLQRTVEVPRRGEVTVELSLSRWANLPAEGWHAGNTHIHYDEKEQRPDERLRLDPRVEDLSVAAVSVLQRRDLAYATNRYPVGFAPRFSTRDYSVDVGEESRHNSEPWEIGYGHESAAIATGVNLSAFCVGVLACPPLFGWLVDTTGSYTAGLAAGAGVLLAALGLLLQIGRSVPLAR